MAFSENSEMDYKAGNKLYYAFACACVYPTMLAGVFFSLLIIDGGSSPAHAQSSACLRLQNQLSSISVGGNTRASPRFHKYDRAARNQRDQIAKTQRMARSRGCIGNIFRLGRTSSCARIMGTLDQMTANLSGLERERRRLAPRNVGTSKKQRQSIIRAMNQNRCFTNNNRRHARTRSLVEHIFGRRDNSGQQNEYFSQRNNTFRTMCVRKLDGYYFPISFSTTIDRFEHDERICQSKCSNTEVALYYHAMPAQNSEDMVSYRGKQPYRELPSAFAYRKNFDEKASCNFSKGIFQEVAGSNGEQANVRKNAAAQRIGKPVFSIDRSLDPESISNNFGNFDTAQIGKLLNKFNTPILTVQENAEAKGIRVVGPVFFPVQ